ncbi:MAG: phage baseplate assembly protein V [Aquincola tertiaricarbonis]|uniref:phage baseplate assembly protein V n=1 Tax=Aquincola TaxID=391952 RepID=UPI000614AEE7|nr:MULTISPECIES: phage baseplate assembly protein V [Aquincola]MCR5868342.1 phage baseplate assembly protein V [Aquincola sp. J276]
MSEGETRRYLGKFRGMVINNIDPMQQGRLQVQVPDVLGLNSLNWALPCLPFTGRQMGFWALPQIGAGVWVEFEQGDPDFPIWTGCWYGNASEVPALALTGLPASPSVLLQTQGQQTLMLSDVPGPTGGILLKTATGAMISINATGITISNGQGATIVMTGPTVTVNGGALAVT